MPIQITRDLVIPEEELRFTASRSGGPGGQNVNKLNTRVTLLFDLEGSRTLSPQQKQQLRHRLANRISNSGILRVTSQQQRRQRANLNLARERFAQLLAQALKKRRARRKTAVPRMVIRQRLDRKRRRGQLKRLRSKVSADEG